MVQHKTEDLTAYPGQAFELPEKKKMFAFFFRDRLDVNHPSLIRFSSTLLFKLDKSPEKYVHLLKKKDREQIVPIVNYFIDNSGHYIYLGGDAVKNLYLHGKRKYKSLNVLVILTNNDVEKFSCVMNNIISSNDGSFSMRLKYLVRKNRCNSCFKDIALARYIIEPRLEGLEKLLYPFRASAIELDLTTHQMFFHTFGIEVR